MTAEATAARLVASAERVFAADGVEAASLRKISRGAGTRNVTAIQYHFGDREGLIRAVLDKHLSMLEGPRHALLDAWEATAERELRGLAGALVRPYAAKLDDPDGGAEFLQIYAGLLARRHPKTEPAALVDPGNSLFRWRQLVDPLQDEAAVQLHRRFTAVTVTITELGRRARNWPGTDHELFISALVDTVAAVLAYRTSAQTSALLGDRFAAEVEEEFGGRRSPSVE